MKTIDLKLKNKRPARVLISLLLTVFLFIFSIGVVGFFLNQNIKEHTSNNRTYFSMTYYLISYDSVVRRSGFMMMTRELVTLTDQLGSSLNYQLAPTPENYQRVLKSKRSLNNLRIAMEVKNVLDLLITRRKTYNPKMSTQRRTFEKILNTLIADTGDKEIAKVALPKGDSLVEYLDGVNPVLFTKLISYFAFTDQLYMRAVYMLDFMNSMRPVMNDKEPPYVFSSSAIIRYRAMVPQILESLRNIFSGPMLAQSEQTINDLRNYIVVDLKKEFYKNQLTISVVLLVLATLYAVYILMFAYYTTWSLHQILASYQHLKTDDIVFNLERFEERKIYLKENIFNELNLIQEVVGNVGNESGQWASKLIAKSGILQEQRRKISFHKLKLRVQRDHYNTSSKFIVIVNFLKLAIIFAFYMLMSSTTKTYDYNIDLETIYLDSIVKLIPVSNNYLKYNLFVIYGNFIKIDGKFLEDIPDTNSMIYDFQTFWNKNRNSFADMIPGDGESEVLTLLYGDICNYFVKTKQRLDLLAACKTHLASRKGFIAFLVNEDIQMQEGRNMVRGQTDFLHQSRIGSITEGPNTEYYFTVENQGLNFIHFAYTDLVIDKLYVLIEGLLNKNFTYIDSVMNDIIYSCLAAILAVIVFSFVMTFRLISANTQVCRETFAVILPETIFNNPLIYNAFDRHFIKQR